jgi:HECT-domain (ubiquitin-transferase)
MIALEISRTRIDYFLHCYFLNLVPPATQQGNHIFIFFLFLFSCYFLSLVITPFRFWRNCLYFPHLMMSSSEDVVAVSAESTRQDQHTWAKHFMFAFSSNHLAKTVVSNDSDDENDTESDSENELTSAGFDWFMGLVSSEDAQPLQQSSNTPAFQVDYVGCEDQKSASDSGNSSSDSLVLQQLCEDEVALALRSLSLQPQEARNALEQRARLVRDRDDRSLRWEKEEAKIADVAQSTVLNCIEDVDIGGLADCQLRPEAIANNIAEHCSKINATILNPKSKESRVNALVLFSILDSTIETFRALMRNSPSKASVELVSNSLLSLHVRLSKDLCAASQHHDIPEQLSSSNSTGNAALRRLFHYTRDCLQLASDQKSESYSEDSQHKLLQCLTIQASWGASPVSCYTSIAAHIRWASPALNSKLIHRLDETQSNFATLTKDCEMVPPFEQHTEARVPVKLYFPRDFSTDTQHICSTIGQIAFSQCDGAWKSHPQQALHTRVRCKDELPPGAQQVPISDLKHCTKPADTFVYLSPSDLSTVCEKWNSFVSNADPQQTDGKAKEAKHADHESNVRSAPLLLVWRSPVTSRTHLTVTSQTTPLQEQLQMSQLTRIFGTAVSTTRQNLQLTDDNFLHYEKHAASVQPTFFAAPLTHKLAAYFQRLEDTLKVKDADAALSSPFVAHQDEEKYGFARSLKNALVPSSSIGLNSTALESPLAPFLHPCSVANRIDSETTLFDHDSQRVAAKFLWSATVFLSFGSQYTLPVVWPGDRLPHEIKHLCATHRFQDVNGADCNKFTRRGFDIKCALDDIAVLINTVTVAATAGTPANHTLSTGQLMLLTSAAAFVSRLFLQLRSQSNDAASLIMLNRMCFKALDGDESASMSSENRRRILPAVWQEIHSTLLSIGKALMNAVALICNTPACKPGARTDQLLCEHVLGYSSAALCHLPNLWFRIEAYLDVREWCAASTVSPSMMVHKQLIEAQLLHSIVSLQHHGQVRLRSPILRSGTKLTALPPVDKAGILYRLILSVHLDTQNDELRSLAFAVVSSCFHEQRPLFAVGIQLWRMLASHILSDVAATDSESKSHAPVAILGHLRFLTGRIISSLVASSAFVEETADLVAVCPHLHSFVSALSENADIPDWVKVELKSFASLLLVLTGQAAWNATILQREQSNASHVEWLVSPIVAGGAFSQEAELDPDTTYLFGYLTEPDHKLQHALQALHKKAASTGAAPSIAPFQMQLLFQDRGAHKAAFALLAKACTAAILYHLGLAQVVRVHMQHPDANPLDAIHVKLLAEAYVAGLALRSKLTRQLQGSNRTVESVSQHAVARASFLMTRQPAMLMRDHVSPDDVKHAAAAESAAMPQLRRQLSSEHRSILHRMSLWHGARSAKSKTPAIIDSISEFLVLSDIDLDEIKRLIASREQRSQQLVELNSLALQKLQQSDPSEGIVLLRLMTGYHPICSGASQVTDSSFTSIWAGVSASYSAQLHAVQVQVAKRVLELCTKYASLLPLLHCLDFTNMAISASLFRTRITIPLELMTSMLVSQINAMGSSLHLQQDVSELLQGAGVFDHIQGILTECCTNMSDSALPVAQRSRSLTAFVRLLTALALASSSLACNSPNDQPTCNQDPFASGASVAVTSPSSSLPLPQPGMFRTSSYAASVPRSGSAPRMAAIDSLYAGFRALLRQVTDITTRFILTLRKSPDLRMQTADLELLLINCLSSLPMTDTLHSFITETLQQPIATSSPKQASSHARVQSVPTTAAATDSKHPDVNLSGSDLETHARPLCVNPDTSYVHTRLGLVGGTPDFTEDSIGPCSIGLPQRNAIVCVRGGQHVSMISLNNSAMVYAREAKLDSLVEAVEPHRPMACAMSALPPLPMVLNRLLLATDGHNVVFVYGIRVKQAASNQDATSAACLLQLNINTRRWTTLWHSSSTDFTANTSMNSRSKPAKGKTFVAMNMRHSKRRKTKSRKAAKRRQRESESLMLSERPTVPTSARVYDSTVVPPTLYAQLVFHNGRILVIGGIACPDSSLPDPPQTKKLFRKHSDTKMKHHMCIFHATAGSWTHSLLAPQIPSGSKTSSVNAVLEPCVVSTHSSLILVCKFAAAMPSSRGLLLCVYRIPLPDDQTTSVAENTVSLDAIVSLRDDPVLVSGSCFAMQASPGSDTVIMTCSSPDTAKPFVVEVDTAESKSNPRSRLCYKSFNPVEKTFPSRTVVSIGSSSFAYVQRKALIVLSPEQYPLALQRRDSRTFRWDTLEVRFANRLDPDYVNERLAAEHPFDQIDGMHNPSSLVCTTDADGSVTHHCFGMGFGSKGTSLPAECRPQPRYKGDSHESYLQFQFQAFDECAGEVRDRLLASAHVTDHPELKQGGDVDPVSTQVGLFTGNAIANAYSPFMMHINHADRLPCRITNATLFSWRNRMFCFDGKRQLGDFPLMYEYNSSDASFVTYKLIGDEFAHTRFENMQAFVIRGQVYITSGVIQYSTHRASGANFVAQLVIDRDAHTVSIRRIPCVNPTSSPQGWHTVAGSYGDSIFAIGGRDSYQNSPSGKIFQFMLHFSPGNPEHALIGTWYQHNDPFSGNISSNSPVAPAMDRWTWPHEFQKAQSITHKHLLFVVDAVSNRFSTLTLRIWALDMRTMQWTALHGDGVCGYQGNCAHTPALSIEGTYLYMICMPKFPHVANIQRVDFSSLLTEECTHGSVDAVALATNRQRMRSIDASMNIMRAHGLTNFKPALDTCKLVKCIADQAVSEDWSGLVDISTTQRSALAALRALLGQQYAEMYPGSRACILNDAGRFATEFETMTVLRASLSGSRSPSPLAVSHIDGSLAVYAPHISLDPWCATTPNGVNPRIDASVLQHVNGQPDTVLPHACALWAKLDRIVSMLSTVGPKSTLALLRVVEATILLCDAATALSDQVLHALAELSLMQTQHSSLSNVQLAAYVDALQGACMSLPNNATTLLQDYEWLPPTSGLPSLRSMTDQADNAMAQRAAHNLEADGHYSHSSELGDEFDEIDVGVPLSLARLYSTEDRVDFNLLIMDDSQDDDETDEDEDEDEDVGDDDSDSDSDDNSSNPGAAHEVAAGSEDVKTNATTPSSHHDSNHGMGTPLSELQRLWDRFCAHPCALLASLGKDWNDIELDSATSSFVSSSRNFEQFNSANDDVSVRYDGEDYSNIYGGSSRVLMSNTREYNASSSFAYAIERVAALPAHTLVPLAAESLRDQCIQTARRAMCKWWKQLGRVGIDPLLWQYKCIRQLSQDPQVVNDVLSPEPPCTEYDTASSATGPRFENRWHLVSFTRELKRLLHRLFMQEDSKNYRSEHEFADLSQLNRVVEVLLIDMRVGLSQFQSSSGERTYLLQFALWVLRSIVMFGHLALAPIQNRVLPLLEMVVRYTSGHVRVYATHLLLDSCASSGLFCSMDFLGWAFRWISRRSGTAIGSDNELPVAPIVASLCVLLTYHLCNSYDRTCSALPSSSWPYTLTAFHDLSRCAPSLEIHSEMLDKVMRAMEELDCMNVARLLKLFNEKYDNSKHSSGIAELFHGGIESPAVMSFLPTLEPILAHRLIVSQLLHPLHTNWKFEHAHTLDKLISIMRRTSVHRLKRKDLKASKSQIKSMVNRVMNSPYYESNSLNIWRSYASAASEHFKKLQRRSGIQDGDLSLDPDSKQSLRHASHLLLSQMGQQVMQTSVASIISQYDRPWTIRFVGEGGYDAGGLFRESLDATAADFNDPASPFFMLCPNGTNSFGDHRDRLILRPSASTALHTRLLYGAGRMLGFCFESENFLSLSLSQWFWQRLHGSADRIVSELRDVVCPASTDDEASVKKFMHQVHTGLSVLSTFDGMAAQCLRYVIEADGHSADSFGDVFDESFVTCASDGSAIELLPDGANIPVTFANRFEYAKLVLLARLTESECAMQALRQGFYSACDIRSYPMFAWQDLELGTCGTPTVDLKFLRKHSSQNCDKKVYEMIWQMLENFSNSQRQQFLRFVWGRSRLPHDSSGFDRQFTVNAKYTPASKSADDSFPMAHTCFFSVDVPAYSSVETMTERFTYAMMNCMTIDADDEFTDRDSWDAAATQSSALW